jgi:hypothetical protein
VQNVDLGYTVELHVDDLRELDSEFQIAFPPQVYDRKRPITPSSVCC